MAHHDNPGHVGIRTKTHKLIYYYGAKYDGSYRTPPAWELYDLKSDPQELKNIYGDPANAKTVESLKKDLATLRKKVGDTGEDFPEVEKVIQEFWNYDDADQAKARELSDAYLKVRKAELAKPKGKKQKKK